LRTEGVTLELVAVAFGADFADFPADLPMLAASVLLADFADLLADFADLLVDLADLPMLAASVLLEACADLLEACAGLHETPPPVIVPREDLLEDGEVLLVPLEDLQLLPISAASVRPDTVPLDGLFLKLPQSVWLTLVTLLPAPAAPTTEICPSEQWSSPEQ
jgi:hypothetical protein